MSAATADLRAMHLLLSPPAHLTTVLPLSAVHPPQSSPASLSLSPLAGLPVLRYSTGAEALEITRLYSL